MELKREQVLGVVNEKKELVCNNCATDQEWAAVSNKEFVVTPEKIKDSKSLFFCDRCATRLKA